MRIACRRTTDRQAKLPTQLPSLAARTKMFRRHDKKFGMESATRNGKWNENEPATKSAASSELKAVNRAVQRDDAGDDVKDDDDDNDDSVQAAAAAVRLVVSNKSSASMTWLSTHQYLHINITSLPTSSRFPYVVTSRILLTASLPVYSSCFLNSVSKPNGHILKVACKILICLILIGPTCAYLREN